MVIPSDGNKMVGGGGRLLRLRDSTKSMNEDTLADNQSRQNETIKKRKKYQFKSKQTYNMRLQKFNEAMQRRRAFKNGKTAATTIPKLKDSTKTKSMNEDTLADNQSRQNETIIVKKRKKYQFKSQQTYNMRLQKFNEAMQRRRAIKNGKTAATTTTTTTKPLPKIQAKKADDGANVTSKTPETGGAEAKQQQQVGIFKCPFCFQRFSATQIFMDHLYFHRITDKPGNENENEKPNKEPEINVDNAPIKIQNQKGGKGPKRDYKSVQIQNVKRHLPTVHNKARPPLPPVQHHKNQKIGRKQPCKVCGRQFTSSKLKIHMRIHTGEKPFKCLLCKMRLRQSSHARRHLKSVHGEHPPTSFSFITTTKQGQEGQRMNDNANSNGTDLKPPIEQKDSADSDQISKDNKTVARRGNAFRRLRNPEQSKSLKSTESTSKPRGRPRRQALANNLIEKRGGNLLRKCQSLIKRDYKSSQSQAIGRETRTRGYNKIQNGINANWNDKHRCNICGKRLSGKSKLDIHLRVHTGEKPYECLLCKRRGRQVHHIKDHLRNFHKENPPKSFTFIRNGQTDISQADAAESAKSESKPPSPPKGKANPNASNRTTRSSFNNKNALNIAAAVKIEVKSDGEASNSQTHTLAVDLDVSSVEKQGDLYKCPKCEYLANHMSKIRRHFSAVHDESRSFKCKKCSCAYTNHGQLGRHITLMHNRTKVTKNRGKGKTVKIQKHSRPQPSNNNVQKSLDDEASATNQDQLITSGNGPAAASQTSSCEPSLDLNETKVFPKIEENEGSESKDNSSGGCNNCKECGITLSSSELLLKHMNTIHATPKKKEFKCLKCIKSFSRLSDLRFHETRYHGRKPGRSQVKCKHCGKIFPSNNLSGHIRIKHNNKNKVTNNEDGKTLETQKRDEPQPSNDNSEKSLDEEASTSTTNQDQDMDNENEPVTAASSQTSPGPPAPLETHNETIIPSSSSSHIKPAKIEEKAVHHQCQKCMENFNREYLLKLHKVKSGH